SLLRTLHTPRSTLFPYTTLFRSFWSLYAHRSGWMEIPSSAPGTAAYQRSLPQPGDIMVWWDKPPAVGHVAIVTAVVPPGSSQPRSEEHTSELQSRFDLVCRLLLE